MTKFFGATFLRLNPLLCNVKFDSLPADIAEETELFKYKHTLLCRDKTYNFLWNIIVVDIKLEYAVQFLKILPK